jgi:hypothetical protein
MLVEDPALYAKFNLGFKTSENVEINTNVTQTDGTVLYSDTDFLMLATA